MRFIIVLIGLLLLVACGGGGGGRGLQPLPQVVDDSSPPAQSVSVSNAVGTLTVAIVIDYEYTPPRNIKTGLTGVSLDYEGWIAFSYTADLFTESGKRVGSHSEDRSFYVHRGAGKGDGRYVDEVSDEVAMLRLTSWTLSEGR